MEDLPLIPAMMIIDYLSIKDVLNLKLVNKWFYQIINKNVRIKDLVITDYNHLPYTNRKWLYTCDLISLQNLIKYEPDYEFVSYINFNQPLILSQLKQLFIYWIPITLETLNSLDGLVHLEIIYSQIKSIANDNNVLRLPMLETLSLIGLNIYNIHENLLIDSTKLERLKIYDFDFNLVHPESITYLEVVRYKCKNFLRSCINLQHLYFYELYPFEFAKGGKFDFKYLPKLMSLHLNKFCKTFVHLFEDKECFNKDMKIHFHNLKWNDAAL